MSGWELGASTLGAPGEPLEEVIETLTGSSARWIELRAAPGTLADVALPGTARAQVLAALERSGIAVLAIASGVRVGGPGADDDIVRDIEAHLRLAAELGARFVRVFPGIPIETGPFDQVPTTLGDRAAAESDAASRLSRAATLAGELGVRIALETHDSNPRGADLARILSQLDAGPSAQIGVIWDLLHPWRVGEELATTWQHLGDRLVEGRGYVQIKDVASRTNLTPVLQGQGLVPLAEASDILSAGGYSGPLSLEWERTWYPEVPPLAVALPAAARAVRALRPAAPASPR